MKCSPGARCHHQHLHLYHPHHTTRHESTTAPLAPSTHLLSSVVEQSLISSLSFASTRLFTHANPEAATRTKAHPDLRPHTLRRQVCSAAATLPSLKGRQLPLSMLCCRGPHGSPVEVLAVGDLGWRPAGRLAARDARSASSSTPPVLSRAMEPRALRAHGVYALRTMKVLEARDVPAVEAAGQGALLVTRGP